MPITFVKTPYQIVSKGLVLQFKDILPKIIQLKKINFSKGRYIPNNVIAIWDDIEWDQTFSIYALFIKIVFQSHMIIFIKIDFQSHMIILSGP